MTTLSVVVRGRYLHGGTSEQVAALIDDVLATVDGGNPWVNLDCGEVADFYFAPTPLTEDTFAEPPFDWAADHQLTVAVNRATGFGALRWDTRSVSVNETPPRDPAVIGDPYVPYWYRPRYTVPLDEVTAAVREFCRDGGARPTSVGWAEDGGDQGSLYLTTDEYRELVGVPAR